MIKYKYFVLLYALQDVILERKKKTKKIDLSRLKVATKSKSRLQQVRRGRSGRIREKSRLSKPTHGRSSCGNTISALSQYLCDDPLGSVQSFPSISDTLTLAHGLTSGKRRF